MARARAFQARGRGFESRFPLHSMARVQGELNVSRVPGALEQKAYIKIYQVVIKIDRIAQGPR